MDEAPEDTEVLRVIHVDDDPVDHLLVSRCLGRAPGPVEVLHQETLNGIGDLARQEQADVLLLDLNFSGYEGLQSLEAAVALQLDLPIVVLTGQDGPALGVAAIENGAEDFLSKDDLGPARLWRTLQHAMTRWRTRTPRANTFPPMDKPNPRPLQPLVKTAPSTPMTNLLPGVLLDRYEIQEEIGKGGMATVYRVRHRTLGSDHALKVLLPGIPADASRLVQEGRAQARLRHPNLVSVTDVLPIGLRVGLVMEYVEGPTLAQWMRTPECHWPDWFPLFTGTVRGVRAAHKAGLIHRDLKPSNVLLQPTEDGLIPKVTDFGIAKQITPTNEATPHTATGICLGTVGYMAPEQMDDSIEVDQRADLFALGCILYRLATGQAPFKGRSHIAVLKSVMLGQRAAILDIAPGLCPNLASIIEQLLEPEAADRLQDCQALLNALDEVDLTRPPSHLQTPPTQQERRVMAGPTVAS